MKKYASRIYLCLIFAILYIPILTLILFSFNSTESTANFAGFSFDWYIKLFSDENAFIALSMSELFYAIVIKNSRTTVFNKFGLVNSLISCSNLSTDSLRVFYIYNYVSCK